jgi:hypothetical protein
LAAGAEKFLGRADNGIFLCIEMAFKRAWSSYGTYIYIYTYIYVCIIYSIHENQSDKWWSIRTVTIDAIDDAWGHHHFISLVKTLAKSNDIYIRNTPLCLGL